MEAHSGQVVAGAFCEVLERLAFMFGELVDKCEMPAPEGTYAEVRVRVSGPLSGVVALVVAPEACAEMAANILGLEPGDALAEARAEDALKELVNVTCGTLLTTLAGTDPVFDVSVPESATIDAEAWAARLASEDTLAFLADDHPVLLHVCLK